MPARPTPPRTDLDTTRALVAASRGHAKYKATRGPVIDWCGRTVYKAEPRQPYGRSTHAKGYLTHLNAHLYIAWRQGKPVGQLMRWRCGGSTQHFVLLAEPTSPLCPVCVAMLIGRSGIQINVAVG